ncbi:MAG TPA: hypothetical protein VF868_16945 [Bacteroidia bacterium]|jgi:hypothetical protein
MKEIEKEFYAHLGLLSIQSARMEQMLHLIAAGLMAGDQFISRTVIQNNNLNSNLDLIKKLNQFRHGDINNIQVNTVLTKIRAVQGQRNLFIHAVWREPNEVEGSIEITCSDMKVAFSENERGKEWAEQTHYVFDIQDIKMKIEELKEIQEIEKSILEEIKGSSFYE